MSINYFTDIGNHLDMNSKYPTKTNLAFESFSNAFLINSVISVTFTTAILEHLRTCNERILLQYPQKGVINSTDFFCVRLSFSNAQQTRSRWQRNTIKHCAQYYVTYS